MTDSWLSRLFSAPADPPPSQVLRQYNYDLEAHYAKVATLYGAYPLLRPKECYAFTVEIIKGGIGENPAPSPKVLGVLIESIYALLKNEAIFEPVFIKLQYLDRADMTHYLHVQEPFYENPTPTLETLKNVLTVFVRGIVHLLPGVAFAQEPQPNTLQVPLFALIGDFPNMLDQLCGLFIQAGENATWGNRTFYRLRTQLHQNILDASGIRENTKVPKEIVLPSEAAADGARPDQIVAIYLKETPLAKVLSMALPFSVPDSAREEHTMIVAGSGAGKTTLIQQIILDDLDRPDPPPMVIIDPKGEFVKRIAHLDIFHPDTGRLRDRLIYLDPNATPPPALNLFAPNERSYSDYDRQDVESELIEDFGYVFSTIGNPLTAKQQVPFNFCVRLLFKTPGATISTFMELLSDEAKFPKDPVRSAEHSPFAHIIARLDPLSNQFFTREFYASNFNETKDQLRARLYSVLGQPRLAAMFSSRYRQLDLYHSMQNKKIVLVNAAVGTPGSEASQLLSRYILTLTVNAAFEQAKTLPKEKWKTAYLICDEFHLFADEFKTPKMLQLGREYRLGILMAFQQMHGKPFTEDLRTALSTNTSVKYASSPEGSDIGYVARDLRTDDAFVRAQTKTRTTGRFACFVRGLLDQPVAITVPFGNIQAQPQMDDEAFAKLLHINRHRLSAPALPAPPERPKPIAALAAPSAPRQHDEPEAPSLPPKSDTGAVDPDAGEHTDPAAKWGA